MRNAFKVPLMLLTLLIIAIGIFPYFIRIQFFDLMEIRTIDLRFMTRGEKKPISRWRWQWSTKKALIRKAGGCGREEKLQTGSPADMIFLPPDKVLFIA
jgi:hypothetical protein